MRLKDKIAVFVIMYIPYSESMKALEAMFPGTTMHIYEGMINNLSLLTLSVCAVSMCIAVLRAWIKELKHRKLQLETN